MTIGQIKFYKMRGSLSSGEYPLFTANQDLSGFLVSSQTAKYSKGLQTHAVVPSFNGYETVNIAEIDGMFYWVTEWHESTSVNMSIDFVLDFMGPTSFMRSGNSLKGIYERTPTNICPYLRQNMTDDILKEDRSLTFTEIDLPIVATFNTSAGYSRTINDHAYWCQITGSTTNNGIKKYGFFISRTDNHPVEGGFPVFADSTGKMYPMISNVLRSIGTYAPGLTAETVMDISISKRCPFKFKRTLYRSSASSTEYYIQITDANGTPFAPNLSVGNNDVVYNLTDVNTLPAEMTDNEQTITMVLSTQERMTAKACIKDWNNNEIMVIPTQLGSSISINARCHSDLCGVYTIITIGDTQVSVPEGKLPYAGNTSDTYRAYQMNSDRLAMIYANRKAEYSNETENIATIGDSVTTALNGLTVGFMGGNPVSAVTGLLTGVTSGLAQVYRNERGEYLEKGSAKMDYWLSQKHALEQPTSNYNVGYGFVYMFLNEINTLRVAVLKASTITTTYFNNWVGQFGYPAEGIRTVTMANGYYRGKLISDTSDKSGMYWDQTNAVFERGFKFISP